MMFFEWSAEAIEDLSQATDYLLAHNPYAVDKLLSKIEQAENALSSFPFMGWSAPDDVRLWPVGAYLLAYKVREEGILVLRLWHGAQSRN